MPDQIVRHNGIPEHAPLCDCLDCRTAWEEWQEAEYPGAPGRLLAAEDGEVRQAKPATDQEWAEFMGAEFPRVKEGVSRG